MPKVRTHENEINAAFGAQLSWQRLDSRKACRIASMIELGGYRDDEAKWPEIQKTMIDAMIRLEAATAPLVAILK